MLWAFPILAHVLTLSGQQIGFAELDFSSVGNRTSLVVNKRGANPSPVSVTITPLTISQYQMRSGTGCPLDPNSIPAEGKDVWSVRLKILQK